MRFPCVAVPAVHDDPDAGMITFGPYCPAEAPGSLAGEALECLPNVAQTSFDALPFSVDDIPLAASAAIFSIAEWTAETLTQQFRALVAFEDIAEPAESIEPATPPPGGRHYPRAVRDPFQSADLLAALVSGDADRFRRLVAIVLDERGGPQRQSVALARGRALAMTGAILEAAERAGFSTGKVWSVMDELPNRLAESNDADAIAKIIRDSLRGLRGADRQTSPSPDDFGALFRFISDHMADGVTLEEAANAVNESPAAISKRLQRKLGMSFSEYKGRVRVDHAKELLRDTQLSIGEISHRVGIEDLSNFSRLFRQHEGIAPGRYRSKYGRRK